MYMLTLLRETLRKLKISGQLVYTGENTYPTIVRRGERYQGKVKLIDRK